VMMAIEERKVCRQAKVGSPPPEFQGSSVSGHVAFNSGWVRFLVLHVLHVI
jgi:hypothetical protein